MTYKKKTNLEKLKESHGLPKVEKIPEKMAKRLGTGTIAIPAPMEVNNLMKKVSKGKVTTMNALREALAKKHKATIGCPICTGIFANISARAAEEEKLTGKKDITPYWRTLKENGQINPKFPGGELAQKKLLESEGYTVIQKGKKYLVSNYENKLYQFK